MRLSPTRTHRRHPQLHPRQTSNLRPSTGLDQTAKAPRYLPHSIEGQRFVCASPIKESHQSFLEPRPRHPRALCSGFSTPAGAAAAGKLLLNPCRGWTLHHASRAAYGVDLPTTLPPTQCLPSLQTKPVAGLFNGRATQCTHRLRGGPPAQGLVGPASTPPG